jgi:hypothetical protein
LEAGAREEKQAITSGLAHHGVKTRASCSHEETNRLAAKGAVKATVLGRLAIVTAGSWEPTAVMDKPRLGLRCLGQDMSNEVPVGPSKGVAVTILGVSTLLLGGSYAAFGAFLILAGAGWFVRPGDGPWLPALFIGRSIAIVIGIAFLPLGTLGLLAGLGALLRKRWGRILSFATAVLATLLGLLWVSGVEDVRQDTPDVVLGAVQLLYGILAIVILIKNGTDFSRLRV